jgi:hypothetical protein
MAHYKYYELVPKSGWFWTNFGLKPIGVYFTNKIVTATASNKAKKEKGKVKERFSLKKLIRLLHLGG